MKILRLLSTSNLILPSIFRCSINFEGYPNVLEVNGYNINFSRPLDINGLEITRFTLFEIPKHAKQLGHFTVDIKIRWR